jgi:hypothetical protein
VKAYGDGGNFSLLCGARHECGHVHLCGGVCDFGGGVCDFGGGVCDCGGLFYYDFYSLYIIKRKKY